MKQQWKKTLIWYGLTVLSVMCITLPMFAVVVLYSGIMFLCHLVTAITVTVRRNARQYIPFSVTAVLIAVAVVLMAASDMDKQHENSIMAAADITAVILTVPFALGVAAAAYRKGRKNEMLEGGNNNE